MRHSAKEKPAMEIRKRGAVHYFVTTPEVPSEAADVVTEKTEPMTLGRMTKQETKVHRKRALRNKVQKAK
jgi:hypothetical protein